jgi:hypothetical protein
MPTGPAAPRSPVVPRTIDRFFEFSLLGMLAAGYFAVVGSGYLDWPTAAITLLGLCLRGLMVAGIVEIHFSNRFIALVTLLYILFWPLDYFFVSESFLTATVHLVCFLAVMKVLTARTNRDYTYIKMIAVVELLTAAVLSISLSFFAYLALFLLLAIAAFSSGEIRRSAQLRHSVARGGLSAFPRRLTLLSASLFTGILVMTGGMFFVLPRTARAALERFVPQRYRLPGFSNGITLGQLGEIKKSSVAVMHVQSYTDGLLDVRWRGATLSRFDGRRWDNPPPEQVIIEPVEHGVLMANQSYYRVSTRPGHNIRYTVQFSDAASDTLFIAGTPGTISINLPFVRYVGNSGSYRIPTPARGDKVNYGVFSFLEDETAPVQATPEPLTSRERAQLLQLPPALDHRIPRLARQVTSSALTEIEKARDVENYLRRNYGYTLQLLPKEVPDPIANFLFDRKKGHCEYFASAMALMLRTAGIPSRVVTGFASGVYNPLTHLQVVRASDAHSWVEAWISGRGWTTFDPTPPDPAASGAGVMARLSMFFDAAEEFWQDWVVSYDLDRQIALASHMDESARHFRFRSFDQMRAWLADVFVRVMSYAPLLAVLAGAGVIFVLFGPSIAAWWRARQRVKRLVRGEGIASDATLLYERMLALLARRGVQKPPWLTPAEFARVLPATEVRGVVQDLTSFYNEFRFGGRRDVAPQMMHLLDRLEKI